MANNKEVQRSWNQLLRTTSTINFVIHSKDNLITRITSQLKKIYRSQRFHHSKPLDLNYKEDSPRADTKIQSSLLPKEHNPDTLREEKACCKKIWMDPEHRKSSSCTCSSLLQQKKCHLSRSHEGETKTVPTRKGF